MPFTEADDKSGPKPQSENTVLVNEDFQGSSSLRSYLPEDQEEQNEPQVSPKNIKVELPLLNMRSPEDSSS